MNAVRRLLVCLIVSLIAVAGFAQDKDAQGCKDSPLITRFPGSFIAKCSDKPDDVARMRMGPNKKDKEIAGEVHYLNYRFPTATAKAEVVRNITTALRNAGFTADYDSGSYGDSTWHKGKTWVFAAVAGNGTYELTIATETALTQEVVADAAALSSGLAATGHIAVYGIHFDTGKSDIKPESAAALKEIANLLQQDPKLKLYVVGHTDNVGALASNMELSRQRAAAIVQALTTTHNIAAARLAAFGAGPYSPVGSNDSEDGRAQNRRVELVKQ